MAALDCVVSRRGTWGADRRGLPCALSPPGRDIRRRGKPRGLDPKEPKLSRLSHRHFGRGTSRFAPRAGRSVRGRGHSLPRCFVKADEKRASAQRMPEERRRARKVLLADGHRRQGAGDGRFGSGGLAGSIGYCPVCDGYEATDRTPFWDREPTLPRSEIHPKLFEAGYLASARGTRCRKRRPRIWPLQALKFSSRSARCANPPDEIRVEINGKGSVDFEIVYPALGCDSRCAARIRSRRRDERILKVDGHQRTTVHGLYAAGDVVSDLHGLLWLG